MSPYVLVFVVLSQWGATSGNIAFGTSEACEAAKRTFISGLAGDEYAPGMLTPQNSVFQAGCFETGWNPPPIPVPGASASPVPPAKTK